MELPGSQLTCLYMFHPEFHGPPQFFMHPGEFFSILVFLILALGFFTLLLIGVFFLVKGWHKRRSEISSQEELAAVQELHQLAIRLEKRIDSLETILYETKSSKQNKQE